MALVGSQLVFVGISFLLAYRPEQAWLSWPDFNDMLTVVCYVLGGSTFLAAVRLGRVFKRAGRHQPDALVIPLAMFEFVTLIGLCISVVQKDFSQILPFFIAGFAGAVSQRPPLDKPTPTP